MTAGRGKGSRDWREKQSETEVLLKRFVSHIIAGRVLAPDIRGVFISLNGPELVYFGAAVGFRTDSISVTVQQSFS